MNIRKIAGYVLMAAPVLTLAETIFRIGWSFVPNIPVFLVGTVTFIAGLGGVLTSGGTDEKATSIEEEEPAP